MYSFYIVSPPPELHQLANLQITNWRSVGLNLGLDDSVLQCIKADYSNHPNHTLNCVIEMFSTWLDSSTNPTYSQVVEALASAGENAAVMKLCEKHGESVHQGRSYYWRHLSMCCCHADNC